ncbi:hypothetical protein CPB83DRAFT_809836 [Crepidotus variabilis]|uniref:PhyH-domain-containing protein n=1 Tax=Crepidotus variabilis TaxID=179855 RepID=A0A9P6JRL1_9AGAR|nr:hypothetical protein CPB83DRAFT_809836 [Crepidotus variabilis]
MMPSNTPLTDEQLASFSKNGYLILRDVLSTQETTALQRWAQEIHDLPCTEHSSWMPYDEIQPNGTRVLCRTENFADSHTGFGALLRGETFLRILNQLSGEEMILFKEKINYKLAGSGGYSAHIDSTAYTHIKNVKHLTILLAIDAADTSNGGLEVVEGSHLMSIPISDVDRCIESSWVDGQTWVPVELKPGEMLIFGSYLAHRSDANASNGARKAVYATYNCKREGDLREQYYADRRVVWPATHMRKAGKSYQLGRMRYGFGSPMLTIN